MPDLPDDHAAAAAARIGDILATAEREVAQIVAAAERRASSDEQARADALDDRRAQLDRRREELDARERALDARQRQIDARAADVAARNVELTEITAELLAGALTAQTQARRLSDLPPLTADRPASPDDALADEGGAVGVDGRGGAAGAGAELDDPPRMSSWRAARPSSARRREDDARTRAGRRGFGPFPPDPPVGDDAPRPSTPAALRIVGPADGDGTVSGAATAGPPDPGDGPRDATADATPPTAGADAGAAVASPDDAVDADPAGAVSESDPSAENGTSVEADVPAGQDPVSVADTVLRDDTTEAAFSARPEGATSGADGAPTTDGALADDDRPATDGSLLDDARPATDGSLLDGAPSSTDDAEGGAVGGLSSGNDGIFPGGTAEADVADADVAEDLDQDGPRAHTGPVEPGPPRDADGGSEVDPGDGPEWRDVLESDEPAGGERPKWRDVLMPRPSPSDTPEADREDAAEERSDPSADSPDKVDSARLVALSMAAEGRSREAVEAVVRDQLGIRDHEALLDYVFGISTPSSIVPSWPPRRRRRPS